MVLHFAGDVGYLTAANDPVAGVKEFDLNGSVLFQLESIDAIVRAYYESVSFDPGRLPDYGRLRTLFHPGARITPPRSDDRIAAEVLEVEPFLERSRLLIQSSELGSRGFRQREVFRSIEAFGNIAHLFSTYESTLGEESAPFERGINSIQLLKQGHGWGVLSMMWDVERQDRLIPSQYTREDS